MGARCHTCTAAAGVERQETDRPAPVIGAHPLVVSADVVAVTAAGGLPGLQHGVQDGVLAAVVLLRQQQQRQQQQRQRVQLVSLHLPG